MEGEGEYRKIFASCTPLPLQGGLRGYRKEQRGCPPSHSDENERGFVGIIWEVWKHQIVEWYRISISFTYTRALEVTKGEGKQSFYFARNYPVRIKSTYCLLLSSLVLWFNWRIIVILNWIIITSTVHDSIEFPSSFVIISIHL